MWFYSSSLVIIAFWNCVWKFRLQLNKISKECFTSPTWPIWVLSLLILGYSEGTCIQFCSFGDHEYHNWWCPYILCHGDHKITCKCEVMKMSSYHSYLQRCVANFIFNLWNYSQVLQWELNVFQCNLYQNRSLQCLYYSRQYIMKTAYKLNYMFKR